MSREALARRQAELVAALVAGDTAPHGFDPTRVRATREALLRKRSAEVGARWPGLRGALGPQWSDEFARWARDRPPQGSWRDGWDVARHLAATGRLGPVAALELAVAEVTFAYDGVSAPRRRRLPALRRHPGGAVLQVAGRLVQVPWPYRARS